MYFSRYLVLAVATSCQALPSSPRHDLGPKEIMRGISLLTAYSQDLLRPVNGINAVTGPLAAVGRGPLSKVTDGLKKLSHCAETHAEGLKDARLGMRQSEQRQVLRAYSDFVKVHELLLANIVRKGNIIRFFSPAESSVLIALKQDRKALHFLATNLIDILHTDRAEEARRQSTSLDLLLTQAIKFYSTDAYPSHEDTYQSKYSKLRMHQIPPYEQEME